MSIQNKIDAYIDAHFITKSAQKCNMRYKDKYLYLMYYLQRLLLMRNNFGKKNENGPKYTIRDIGRITNEIYYIQDRLEKYAKHLKIDHPAKYTN